MAQKCKMNVSKDLKKVVFELLSSCNLCCAYCFYHEKKHSKVRLPLADIYRKIDIFQKDGIGKLVLTGGEPTLHPNFIEIANYAIAKIPKVSVCTNADIIHETVEFCRQFSSDIVISTIYYEHNPIIAKVDREYYVKKANEILGDYTDIADIALVGFGISCSKEDCPDKKYVFMINQCGELVDCYWKGYKQI